MSVSQSNNTILLNKNKYLTYMFNQLQHDLEVSNAKLQSAESNLELYAKKFTTNHITTDEQSSSRDLTLEWNAKWDEQELLVTDITIDLTYKNTIVESLDSSGVPISVDSITKTLDIATLTVTTKTKFMCRTSTDIKYVGPLKFEIKDLIDHDPVKATILPSDIYTCESKIFTSNTSTLWMKLLNTTSTQPTVTNNSDTTSVDRKQTTIYYTTEVFSIGSIPEYIYITTNEATTDSATVHGRLDSNLSLIVLP